MQTVEPLRFRGNELVLFHVLDPSELEPRLREPVLLVDMETDEAIEASPEYARTEYRERMGAHIEDLRRRRRLRELNIFSANRPAA